MYYKRLTITITCSTDPVLLCTISTFSINKEVCGQFIYDFFISILLKLALTVVKDVFCDVNCMKCKKCMVLDFILVK